METEQIIERTLAERRGRKQGISAQELSERAGCSERMARDVVARLIDEKHLPIGSHPAFGFYWIVDSKDKELACRNLRSRGIKILKRLSILEKRPVGEVAEQLSFLTAEE